jgi:hypothetical protein
MQMTNAPIEVEHEVETMATAKFFEPVYVVNLLLTDLSGQSSGKIQLLRKKLNLLLQFKEHFISESCL